MPDTIQIDARTARILPWVVAIAFFMQTLDGTILNTALPSMAASLSTHPLQMQGVVIAYMLTVALLIPVSGWLADRFGIRQVFLAAIFVFTLGSLACAMSPTLDLLIASRVLQGIGGAILVPVGRLSILRAYPRDQLVRILSFITIPGLLGPLVGPTLGGFLVNYASWHWIFLINLPVGILGVICALRYMPNIPRAGALNPFDKFGFLFFSTFMLTLTIALEGIGEHSTAYTKLVLLLVTGFVSLAVYCFYARRSENPLFSPDLFRVRNFSVGIAGNLFARLGTGAMPFLTPLLLQVSLGFTPLKAGMTMIPMTLGAMIAKSVVTPLVNHLGYRLLLSINTVFLGIMIAGFSLISKEMPYPVILLIFTVFGMINSMQFSAMNTITLLDLSDEQASSGNSLLSVIMQLSMSMGVAIAAAILGEFSGIRSFSATGDLASAFRSTYLCLGFMAILSALIFYHVTPSAGKKGTKKNVYQQEKKMEH
ncbi:multidrug transporter subunit MdtD [Oxalobacter vibrioformis]|uniref:Multidrug transporter subunit MdtD n=1 Tax=Oxalobacter vibrioformis TaxID=933080 RepID=A0A9E9LYA8_9BURK|nr:multidrug transporter subunit MdtD [Oxalobacter vibrioformis]WAW09669.1 multidrug transporter subunit MdtD [Oxalobacter vibrioformis]